MEQNLDPTNNKLHNLGGQLHAKGKQDCVCVCVNNNKFLNS